MILLPRFFYVKLNPGTLLLNIVFASGDNRGQGESLYSLDTRVEP